MTKAAAELFTTQQNLSAYIKRLEEFYGLPLFIRRPRMELTPFGEDLYHYAQQIQITYDQIWETAQSYKNVNELHLGCRSAYPHDYSDWLSLGSFQQEHPNVKLIFYEYESAEGIQRLLDQTIDFLFIGLYNASITDNKKVRGVHICDRSSYVLISRQLLETCLPDNLDANIERWKKGIALKELKSVPYFRLTRAKAFKTRSKEEDYLKEHGMLQDKLGECFSRSGALQLCRQNACYFVSGDPEPESDDFFSFPVIEPDTRYELYCLCNTDILETAYGRDFWKLVVEAGKRSRKNGV